MNLKDLLGNAYKEGMTADELFALDITVPENGETQKLRNALTRANSEAADYKRRLEERMTAEEKEKEAQAKLQQDYQSLLKQIQVSENKASLISIGYDEELASSTAEAMANGETKTVIENQKKFREMVEKQVRAAGLKETPKPTGDGEHTPMTRESLKKMSSYERMQYAVAHPDEYKAAYQNDRS